MRIKKAKLEYMAIMHDWNSHSLKYVNVLGDRLKDDIIKLIKSGDIHDRKSLKKRVIVLLRYYYMSKAEYEVMVGDLFCKPEEMFKIDVWYQLEPNIDHIIDHIIREMDLGY